MFIPPRTIVNNIISELVAHQIDIVYTDVDDAYFPTKVEPCIDDGVLQEFFGTSDKVLQALATDRHRRAATAAECIAWCKAKALDRLRRGHRVWALGQPSRDPDGYVRRYLMLTSERRGAVIVASNVPIVTGLSPGDYVLTFPITRPSPPPT